MIINKLFNFIGGFGINNPHDGYEANILISGVKPIGMLCFPLENVNSSIPVLISPDAESLIRQTQKQIKLLDQAVSHGMLKKVSVEIGATNAMNDPLGFTGHFYCQPGLEQEMYELADFHETLWRTGEIKPLRKHVGNYLGYTEADIHLFENGGYNALNPTARFLLRNTILLRRYCRAKSMNCENDIRPG